MSYMSDLNLQMNLKLRGGPEMESGLKRITGATTASTKQMANSWSNVDKRMQNVWGSMAKIAALIGGGALLRQAITDVTEFERGLTEMRLTGQLTAKEMENIRGKIIAMSSETLQLPEDQLATFKDMVAAGIDPKQVIGGIKAINRTATASFSDTMDIGKSAVDLFQKMDIKPEKLERAFNIMHQAGKLGRFELKDAARYFPEILAAASQYGIKGEKGVAQMAAMLQIARRNRADPGEAATDMKAFFGHMVSYRKQFMKKGFDVYDYIDLKSGKFKAGKDIDVFFEDLKKKTHGGSAAMLKSIGIQDYEASNFMAGVMKDWGDYKKIRDEALGAADKNIIGNDFDEVNKTSYAKMKRLQIERSKAMKSAGSSELAEKTFSVGNWAIEHPITTGGGALGGYAGWKLLQRYVGARWPAMINNPAAQGAVARAAAGGMQMIPAAGLASLPAAGAAAVGYGSITLGKYLAEAEAKTTSTRALMELRSRQMVMGGGPGSFQVKTIDAELARRAGGTGKEGGPWDRQGPDVKNIINLTVSVDSNNRTTTNSDDRNTTINTMKRGKFLEPLASH